MGFHGEASYSLDVAWSWRKMSLGRTVLRVATDDLGHRFRDDRSVGQSSFDHPIGSVIEPSGHHRNIRNIAIYEELVYVCLLEALIQYLFTGVMGQCMK